MIGLPFGNAAWATRSVSLGIKEIACGCIVIGVSFRIRSGAPMGAVGRAS